MVKIKSSIFIGYAVYQNLDLWYSHKSYYQLFISIFPLEMKGLSLNGSLKSKDDEG